MACRVTRAQSDLHRAFVTLAQSTACRSRRLSRGLVVPRHMSVAVLSIIEVETRVARGLDPESRKQYLAGRAETVQIK